MEIFVVIVLVVIVFILGGIKRVITNVQNTLFDIDSHLESLNDRFIPPKASDDDVWTEWKLEQGW